MDTHDIAIAAAIAKGKGGGSGGGYTKAETDALLNEKQNTLTTAQLAAVNSGVTEEKVAQYDDMYNVINYSSVDHNGIYRGKDLTSLWVENGKAKEELYTKVHAEDFSDLYLGDYITIHLDIDLYLFFTGTEFTDGVTYYEQGGTILDRVYTATTDTVPDSSKNYFTLKHISNDNDLMIAGFNYYHHLGTSSGEFLNDAHIAFIPRSTQFMNWNVQMNPTATTEGGYLNSYMHQTCLPCVAKSLKNALNGHLLQHYSKLSNAVNPSTPSMAGAGIMGASSGWEDQLVELQLMTEHQIYGGSIWTSSGYDVGYDYEKLPVFDFMNYMENFNNTMWLRSVVSSKEFASLAGSGYANLRSAERNGAVCPLILFG